MNTTLFQENIRALLEVLPESVQHEEGIYLVGGCVRDAWLGKPIHDIDMVIQGDTKKIARATANAYHGSCYLLDEERHTWRVQITWHDEPMVIDFAAPRALAVEDDLNHRDFTINAMAVPVWKPDELLDVCNGWMDLQRKVIRVCSDTSFLEDPVRTIRAVRFAADLGFRIEPQTFTLLKDAVSKLQAISSERVRDELFKIFICRQPTAAIRVLETCGILSVILPELVDLQRLDQPYPDPQNAWEHTLGVMKGMHSLLEVLIGAYQLDAASNLILGSAVQVLGRYRFQLEEFLKNVLVQERPQQGLLLLSTLLHDVGKTQVVQIDGKGHSQFPGHAEAGKSIAEQICIHLKFSNAEIIRITNGVYGHQIIHQMAESKIGSTPLDIYHLFRKYEDGVLDVCLIGLADTLGKYQQQPPLEYWMKELQASRTLMEAWFEKRQELVDPPRLLDGRELMELLHLKPGPEIGTLLESIREQQVCGSITSSEEAKAWLQKSQPRKKTNYS
jgi:tRNA nucleotidyltransferase/poly(A) polymerase